MTFFRFAFDDSMIPYGKENLYFFCCANKVIKLSKVLNNIYFSKF